MHEEDDALFFMYARRSPRRDNGISKVIPMSEITEATSQKIKNMSIICALLVVTIHIPFPETGLSWLFNRVFRGGIAAVAVPYFFVVSGYFLSAHFGESGWYGRELRKRVRTLLVPFVVWTAIAICLVTPIQIVADILAERPFGTTPYFSNGRWLGAIGFDLRRAPSCVGALWYVRCLLLFVVLSPLFRLLVTHLGGLWLLVAFSLTLFHRSTALPVYSDLYYFFTFGFSLSGVFYFSLGMWIRFVAMPRCNVRFLSVFSILVSLSFLIAKACLIFQRITLPIDLTTLSIPFMMYALWTLVPATKWPVWLTGSSFPIFLMHMPMIPYFALPVKYSFLKDTFTGNVLVLVCVTAIPIAITVCLQRRFPKLSRFLFAGRA